MKKIFIKIKNTSLFFKLMALWIIIVIAAIAVIARYEWKLLEDYQGRYDAAKADSDPRLFIDDYMESFTLEEYTKILRESISLDNPYYTIDSFIDIMASEYNAESLRVVSAENWEEDRPVYDIMSGEKLLVTVVLGVAGKDEFGFNRWKAATISPKVDDPYSESANFVISSNMKAEINGVPVTEESIAGEVERTYYSVDVAGCIGSEFKVYRYHVGNLMEGYKLKITDQNGNELTDYKDNEGVMDFVEGHPGLESGELYKRIDYMLTRYMYYINNMEPLENMLSCVVQGSKLYNTISGTYSSAIKYVIKPVSLNITARDITDVAVCSADTIVCKVHYAADKNFSYNVANPDWKSDTADYLLTIKKLNGQWYLEKMIII